MKKEKVLALLACSAIALSSVFVSCANSDPETKEVTKEVKVDKTYASEVTFTLSEDKTSLTLATTTEGAVIHYTTNGATPTSGSATYSTALTLTDDSVIKALAVKDGIENSPVSVFYKGTVYKDSENAVGKEVTIDGKIFLQQTTLLVQLLKMKKKRL